MLRCLPISERLQKMVETSRHDAATLSNTLSELSNNMKSTNSSILDLQKQIEDKKKEKSAIQQEITRVNRKVASQEVRVGNGRGHRFSRPAGLVPRLNPHLCSAHPFLLVLDILPQMSHGEVEAARRMMRDHQEKARDLLAEAENKQRQRVDTEKGAKERWKENSLRWKDFVTFLLSAEVQEAMHLNQLRGAAEAIQADLLGDVPGK